jgi:hypothetical protein
MKYEEFFESVSGLASQLSDLHLQMATQQEPLVEHLIATRSRDTKTIEQTLDRLLDVACHDSGLKLFRRLCRHYWTINPRATASYVRAYRELWDEESESVDADSVTIGGDA